MIEYDGRSFLKRSVLLSIGDRPFESRVTTATYSSEGVLHHKTYDERPTPWSMRGTPRVSGDDYVFYFAGRPVAQLGVEVKSGEETSRWLILTTDHLGTPVLASRQDGVEWSGGFEPFGGDYAGASDGGVFLRFPGQWDDGSWLSGSSYYNVHRWYQLQLGRYSRTDPVGISPRDLNPLTYSRSSPLRFFDTLGLAIDVDPSLEPFVACARTVPIFDIAWKWFENNGDWSLRPLNTSPHGDARVYPHGKDYGVPSCSEGGRIFPEDTALRLIPPERACPSVVAGIAHEIVEAWAHCELGLSETQAHNFVWRGPTKSTNGLDDDIGELGCSDCKCKFRPESEK